MRKRKLSASFIAKRLAAIRNMSPKPTTIYTAGIIRQKKAPSNA